MLSISIGIALITSWYTAYQEHHRLISECGANASRNTIETGMANKLTGCREVWKHQRVVAQFLTGWLPMLASINPGACALHPKPAL